MPAVEDGKISQDDVVAVLQGYRFIPDSWIFCSGPLARSATQAFSPNETGAQDGKVVNLFADDQAVVPVAMAEILIMIPLVWFRCVVLTLRTSLAGDDGSSLIEIEGDVVLEMNRVAKIISSRKKNRTAAGCSRRFDRLVDRRCIDASSIAFRAESAHIVDRGPRSRSLPCQTLLRSCRETLEVSNAQSADCCGACVKKRSARTSGFGTHSLSSQNLL